MLRSCILWCLLSIVFPSFLTAQVISIAQARNLGAGNVVTVRGIVTNGAELGKIRYLQDGTAGMAAFPGTGSAAGFETSVQAGDSIEVTGTLVSFQNLLEISPITAYTVIASGNPLPAPRTVALSEISENLESQLLDIECVTFAGAGGTFTTSSTYDIADSDGGQAKIYLRGGHPLLGTAIPTGAIRLTAILSQFGDFQLLPRYSSDFTEAPCFYLVGAPTQSNISTTGFDVAWSTNLTASTLLLYGTTPTQLTQQATAPGNTLTHSVSLSNLQPGTIYWTQAVAIHNNDTLRSDVLPFATQSLSTGEIRVYFNHAIDPQFVGDKPASGQSFDECRDAILARINAAQQTVDVAMYNNTRSDLVDALVAAHQRGVRVRYVASLDANSAALEPAPPFPVVYGNNIALMHNKFMVIDADLTNQAWVMGGSMNWTNQNMIDDYNNLLFIQDQSLARTYEIEFEEMWGSDGAQPAPLNQRFGSMKRDNTPHQFIIGGIPVQSYFSPSDGVTQQIVNTIQSANASAEFALLTFTKDEPANALVEAFTQNNVAVRGLIDNTNDNGSEYNFLLGNGVPVAGHTFSGILHHKYVVVDALQPTSDPTVLTGSHNWSFTAETQNDENTLIIHDADIARLYRAEFEKRVEENPISSTQEPQRAGFQIFPNPTTQFFVLKNARFDLDPSTRVEVWDLTGKRLLSTPLQVNVPVQIGHLPNGSYVVKVIGANGFAALPLQKVER